MSNTPAAVLEALDHAMREGPICRPEGLEGYSGAKVIGLLQRLARQAGPDAAYLEIGVFRGLTLVSVAAAAGQTPCFGIDNFSQFDPRGENQSVVRNALARAQAANVTLINADFEDALLGLGRHVGPRRLGAYFVDGPHDYRSQYLCLDFAKPFLHPQVAIVVDDANYEHVRRASRDWLLANPEFALAFEAYTACHPQNMTTAQHEQARAGWWNGIHVIVRDPANTLERIYPEVDSSREVYFNEHLVHSMRHASLAPAVMEAFARPRARAVRELLRLVLQRPASARPYETLNTDSGRLPEERVARLTGRSAGQERK